MISRILLIGKNGQVGSELVRSLPSIGHVTAVGRDELDLSDRDDIRRTILEVRPSVIVNAAAYTAVDRAEKEEAIAHAVNAEAPGVIAEEAKKIGAVVVHYSTDYVFDGTGRVPYHENDPTNPLSAYGRTKLAGEEAIRAVGASHFIFRTAWVYATSGKNFLLTIVRLAAEREELWIVNDQFGAPTWSRDIAAATARVLEHTLALPNSADSIATGDSGGTYHLTSAGQTTWHEFAVAILDDCSRIPADTPWLTAASGGRPLVARRIAPITTQDYPTPARRPAFSVLSNERFARSFGFALPDWRSQLSQAVSPGSSGG